MYYIYIYRNILYIYICIYTTPRFKMSWYRGRQQIPAIWIPYPPSQPSAPVFAVLKRQAIKTRNPYDVRVSSDSKQINIAFVGGGRAAKRDHYIKRGRRPSLSRSWSLPSSFSSQLSALDVRRIIAFQDVHHDIFYRGCCSSWFPHPCSPCTRYFFRWCWFVTCWWFLVVCWFDCVPRRPPWHV